jgi:hypothetical protein
MYPRHDYLEMYPEKEPLEEEDELVSAPRLNLVLELELPLHYWQYLNQQLFPDSEKQYLRHEQALVQISQ